MSNIIFTSNAAKRIAEITTPDQPYFRVKVVGGGCQGFSYEMEVTDEKRDGDLEIVTDGQTLLVDEISAEYLAGSTVDFVEELIGAAFKVTNPNASSACGCGVSFAL